MYSCQKETSFEQGVASKGSLLDSLGDCYPKTLAGTYKAGQALTDSNYMTVTVDVLQAGSYTIVTDTVNGYSFKGTGTFNNTGATSVKLKGSGTPIVDGTDNFVVVYDSTFCSVPVTVLPGSTGGGSGVFTLAGSPGSCMNSSVAGTYTQGTALTTTNKVTIQVNVTTIGTWSVSTTTVGGMSFSNTGNFTATGVQNIVLNGTGTPTNAGPQTFSITAGSTSCTFSVTVAPNSAPPAVFTLAGSPSTCMSFALGGTYTQGTAMTAANKVTIQVNVTTAGQWNVSTNTVAGISFAGSGTFTATGVQGIVLQATGTPTASGAQTYTVTAGTATCTFTVTISPATTASGDHFILTPNSWWSYNTPVSASDTLKRTIVGSFTIAGSTWQGMKEKNGGGQLDDTVYFHKTGNNYYNINYAEYYSTVFFDNLVIDSILVMKEGLTTGATWSSPEYSDAENGVPTKVKYNFTCTNANATVTINSRTYTNVYQVTMVAMVAVNGGSYTTDVTWTNYYAQGIGWIYSKYDDGSFQYELPIRYYQVF